jgi:CheY-like chemotaxis protein
MRLKADTVGNVAQLLLVEDDAAIRGALIRALTDRGQAVTSMPSAMAALQHVLDSPPSACTTSGGTSKPLIGSGGSTWDRNFIICSCQLVSAPRAGALRRPAQSGAPAREPPGPTSLPGMSQRDPVPPGDTGVFGEGHGARRTLT